MHGDCVDLDYRHALPQCRSGWDFGVHFPVVVSSGSTLRSPVLHASRRRDVAFRWFHRGRGSHGDHANYLVRVDITGATPLTGMGFGAQPGVRRRRAGTHDRPVNARAPGEVHREALRRQLCTGPLGRHRHVFVKRRGLVGAEGACATYLFEVLTDDGKVVGPCAICDGAGHKRPDRCTTSIPPHPTPREPAASTPSSRRWPHGDGGPVRAAVREAPPGGGPIVGAAGVGAAGVGAARGLQRGSTSIACSTLGFWQWVALYAVALA